ncbi:MAG: hypothetical protein H7Y88_05325, partial [Phycisphaerales bacterium]|nr:hypothetical protein [Phycisphaerales bacterium]
GAAFFMVGQPGDSQAGSVAVMGLLALGPLLIGALISPGSRIREIGIVLLVSGVFLGLGAAMVALVLLSPGFRAMLPPNAAKDLTLFPSPVVGIAFTLAMIAGGFTMLLRGPYRPSPG